MRWHQTYLSASNMVWMIDRDVCTERDEVDGEPALICGYAFRWREKNEEKPGQGIWQ